MRYLALIKKNIVESIAFGDDEFRSHILGDYQYVIDVTDRDRPSAGDSYYPETDTFLSNNTPINTISVDMSAPYLCQGTEDGFEPFTLSKYTVSYENGMVRIGCKQYSAAGLLDTLHKFLMEDNVKVAHCFRVGETPGHGKFPITWDDAQLLYDALIRIKL